MPVTTPSLIDDLRDAVRGEVYADAARRGMYATDASHYQIMPRCVVVPRDDADLAAVVRLANRYGVPITGRGAGTGNQWHCPAARGGRTRGLCGRVPR
ncbi:MAG: FAD-binding oxidoreductase [Phycisphaeraceae bacterium]